MNTKLNLWFMFVCLCLPTPVWAEPLAAGLVLRLLPEYTPCEYQGVRYACYTLEQQKALMALETNAKTSSEQMIAANTALQLRTQEIELAQKQITLLLQSELASKTFIDKQTTELNKAIKEKNDWRAEAETPVIWPYIIGGIVGVLGLGFGVGASLFN